MPEKYSITEKIERAGPWLAEAFPGLDRIPWTPLVQAPTPVERLEKASARLGHEVWIKRDDLTSPLYGGNKPRKLEFILGEALARNKKNLITCGGVGTNHGLAAAIFGRQLGFDVRLKLFHQPITSHVRRNLRLFDKYGAQMDYCGSMARFVATYFFIERLRRPRAFFIAPGGSDPLGTLGYVDAGLELGRQINQKEMPRPKRIFVALGSGGTVAGLILGLRLAGVTAELIGVRVVSPMITSRRSVLSLARRTVKLLRRYDSTIPETLFNPADLRVDGDYLGPGYGHATDVGRQARELMAETEGIPLELTYTGKTFGALCQYLQQNSASGPVLFWNTYNSVDFTAVAEAVDVNSLPPSFQKFFDR